MACMFHFARCINIIFNEMCQQRVKYDVHTTSKIKFIHTIIYHIYCLITEAHGCEQLVQCYTCSNAWPGRKPTTSQSPYHSATMTIFCFYFQQQQGSRHTLCRLGDSFLSAHVTIPAGGTASQHSQVLRHELLMSFCIEVVRSLKTIRINFAATHIPNKLKYNIHASGGTMLYLFVQCKQA